MKKQYLLAALLFCTGAVSAFTPPFENARIARKENRADIVYGTGVRRRVGAAVFPARSAGLVSFQVKDGSLIIDTAKLFEQDLQGTVRMSFFGINVRDLVKEMGNKTNRISLHLKTDRAGIPLILFFEGTQMKDGKRVHYWKSKAAVSNGGEQVLVFEQILPPSIRDLSVRFDIKGGGVISVRKVLCESVAVESELDPARNYLWNGGAERGFYGTFMNAPEFCLPGGAPAGWTPRFGIDRTEKHSGKAAFRFGRTGGNERVYFNPVPFEFGRSIHFSAYLKADAPCRAVMALFVTNGGAYEKDIRIGTEWTKHELYLPSWGESVTGIRKIGNLGPGALGTVFRHAFPHFTFPSGVSVWVDDMAVYSGGRGEYVPARGIVASGRLERGSHRYVPGEEISAVLDFSNLDPAPGRASVSWELSSFDGAVLRKGTEPEVSVTAYGEVRKKYSVRLPENRIGPMNLRFEVNGSPIGFYFGVLPPGKKSADRRIGMNYSWCNHEQATEMLADFRIGAIRHWSHDDGRPWRGFNAVDVFAGKGFYNLMCLSTQPDLHAQSQVPYDLAPWAAEVGKLAGKYRGKIHTWEILNEPNIWSGLRKNPDPSKYRDITPAVNAECIAALGAAVRKADPEAKLAGPATCGTSTGWPVSVLAAGASRYLDVISEHPYRELPELPDYGMELNALKSAVGKFRTDYPVIGTEAGYRSMAVFPDHQRIPEFARFQAAASVRLILTGLVGGLDQFYLFSFSFREQGTGYGSSMMGGADNSFHPLAGPVLYAVRGMIDRIYGASPLKRIPVGSDYRCYLFDRGDARIAALWKWNGEAETVEAGGLRNDGKLFDLFGNVLDPERFSLGASPCYFETELSAGELERKISALPLRGGGVPLKLTLRVVDSTHFEVGVLNLTGKSLSGELAVAGRKTAFHGLKPEEMRFFRFTSPETIGLKPQQIDVETVAASSGSGIRKRFELKGIFPPECSRTLKVDGDPSDWPSNAAVLPLKVRTKLKCWSPAEDSLRADARIAWDRDYLYFLISVNKADVWETPMKTPATLFLGDSVQIAFDPLRNARPGTGNYQDDDFEYAVGRLNGKAVVYRHFASSSSYDSFDKPLGVASDVKAAVSVKNGKTVYEVAFPRRAVSPFRLEPGMAMRVNVLLNIGNENGRAGYFELTPGIGSAPKAPAYFMDLILGKERK